jgi:hypothetical protein
MWVWARVEAAGSRDERMRMVRRRVVRFFMGGLGGGWRLMGF